MHRNLHKIHKKVQDISHPIFLLYTFKTLLTSPMGELVKSVKYMHVPNWIHIQGCKMLLVAYLHFFRHRQTFDVSNMETDFSLIQDMLWNMITMMIIMIMIMMIIAMTMIMTIIMIIIINKSCFYFQLYIDYQKILNTFSLIKLLSSIAEKILSILASI